MQSSHDHIPLADQPCRFEPVIGINEKKNVITCDGNRQSVKFSRQTFMQVSNPSVIDEESLQMVQILQLHRAVDRTRTATGSAVLLRSLTQPCTDLRHIRSKQDALREIASNDRLRRALADFVHEYEKGECALYMFFNKNLIAMFPYRDLKKARKAAAKISRGMPVIPVAESSYLKALIANLRAYRGTSIDQMMNGSIYQTFGGLKSGREVAILTPRLKFVPHRFSRWLLAGPVVAAAPHVWRWIGLTPSLSPLMTHIGIVGTGACAFYSLMIKPVRDTGKFIEPLRAKCIRDQAFQKTIDTIGMIDELLGLHRFASDSPSATVLPTVSDEKHHFFEATGLMNPVLVKDNTDFVPNTIRMNGARLTFISGPNSGGKTTLCKSIVHNQLLAQMGSYVLAEAAAFNIADMISYQAPRFDELQDAEGRFGTELSRTRDIFFGTSPKSLVILDELAEGTTYEERLQESTGIMHDFYTIGNNTVLVTHNHGLIDTFVSEGKGQSLMVELDGEDPTYRIVPGISRVSHADRIARKINFSKEDRRRYLKEKGYIQEKGGRP